MLKSKITANDQFIWFHVASLGEFEQGLPIIEQIKKTHPQYKILLTFFSPSGYEVKKNTKVADVVTYLPMDTKSNVKRFLSLVNPKMAIFIKYEIWPNYLRALKSDNVPTFLVSALFKKRQIYFKPFGGFMKKSLKKFNHFFVQNDSSKKLLSSIGLTNVTVSGDSRFDRVSKILERENQLDFMEVFKDRKACFVAGSSWPGDEEIIVPFLNESSADVKYVFAPHNIKSGHLTSLQDSIKKKSIRYSEISQNELSSFDVLIVDTIGLLTKIYSYADIAYVGGGFATGLHNTLEPAVFGIPVIIGPNYKGFQEAEQLVKRKGILSVKNSESFQSMMQQLLSDKKFYENTGKINSNYISESIGATQIVMQHLDQFL